MDGRRSAAPGSGPQSQKEMGSKAVRSGGPSHRARPAGRRQGRERQEAAAAGAGSPPVWMHIASPRRPSRWRAIRAAAAVGPVPGRRHPARRPRRTEGDSGGCRPRPGRPDRARVSIEQAEGILLAAISARRRHGAPRWLPRRSRPRASNGCQARDRGSPGRLRPPGSSASGRVLFEHELAARVLAPLCPSVPGRLSIVAISPWLLMPHPGSCWSARRGRSTTLARSAQCRAPRSVSTGRSAVAVGGDDQRRWGGRGGAPGRACTRGLPLRRAGRRRGARLRPTEISTQLSTTGTGLMVTFRRARAAMARAEVPACDEELASVLEFVATVFLGLWQIAQDHPALCRRGRDRLRRGCGHGRLRPARRRGHAGQGARRSRGPARA